MFRFTCSVVLWGGRGAADKCHWHVWGALAVFWPHWVCPAHGVCFPRLHCSGSRLLSRERALGCMHLPDLSCSDSGFLLRFRFSGTPQRCRLGWACVLSLPCPSSSGSQEHSPRVQCAFSPLRSQPVSCVCSGELDSSCDPPGGCQPSRISGSLWLETGSLFALW